MFVLLKESPDSCEALGAVFTFLQVMMYPPEAFFLYVQKVVESEDDDGVLSTEFLFGQRLQFVVRVVQALLTCLTSASSELKEEIDARSPENMQQRRYLYATVMQQNQLRNLTTLLSPIMNSADAFKDSEDEEGENAPPNDMETEGKGKKQQAKRRRRT